MAGPQGPFESCPSNPVFSRRSTVHPVFGSFVEHLGRCVYDGIYEPGHDQADSAGFRNDVKELIKELGVSAIRYPGGNFVSGFKWEDSIGPVELRPKRLDLAWHSTETNEVGLHEFAGWLEEIGSELMLAVNLGTRGTEEALELLEYCNLPFGTALADERSLNGRDKPFNIKMWCLGNEMDGPWQIGHRSADDYGKVASQTAKAMRQLDPSIELVACGSSSADMPTFGEWERVVLSHTYDDVDFISCHAYYEIKDGDLGSFLASAANMDRFIDSVTATADHIKAVRGSNKTLNISFDEWNVWYNERFEKVDKITGIDNWPIAPRLLEDTYTVADAVVVGNLLISLLNHADRVTSASLAQLVNVIAPIMTEPGGPAWKQTTFFPFALTSHNANGSALDTGLQSETYDTTVHGRVWIVDAAATHNPADGTTSVFLVNRSTDQESTVTIDTSHLHGVQILNAQTLTDADVFATNTLANPQRVQLQALHGIEHGNGSITLTLPPVSWTALFLTSTPDQG